MLESRSSKLGSRRIYTLWSIRSTPDFAQVYGDCSLPRSESRDQSQEVDDKDVLYKNYRCTVQFDPYNSYYPYVEDLYTQDYLGSQTSFWERQSMPLFRSGSAPS